MGRKVKICKVLMIPQICFIAIPRKAARKKFAIRELVIPFCITWKTALVFFEEAIFEVMGQYKILLN